MRTLIAPVMALITVLCACFTVNTAKADGPIPLPVICDTPRETTLFALGVRKGRNLADQAIARVTDPAEECPALEAVDDLQLLIQAAVDAIVIPPAATEPVRCHIAGQIAGLLDQIQQLQEDCLNLCVADGEFIGQIAAELYCALSIALNGLVPVELFIRLATDECGVNFQVACDTKFEEVSTADPLCLPFTEGVHTTVYLEVQNNQCADNPDEP